MPSPVSYIPGGFNPPGSPQAAAGFNNPTNNAFAAMGQDPTLGSGFGLTTLFNNIAFIPGGFNPLGSPQVGAGFNNPANNAFAAMGQDPTLGGGFGLTTLFNNINSNPIDMYTKMNFDPQTATYLAAANNQIPLDATGLQPKQITIDANGVPTVGSMSNQVLKIALDACQIDPATGKPKDPKGFMSLMGHMAKDSNALQDPRFQKLVPAYQQLMGSVGAQSAALTTGANAAQAQQMAQIQVMMQQLIEQNKKLVALLAESGIPADKLNAIMNPSATATTTPVTTTAATPTQSLLQNTINPKAT